MSTPEKLRRLGERVAQERVNRGWSKEQAAREAGISSITWKRIEDGLTVQDMKRRAAEIALGWEYGSMDRVMDGRGPVVMVTTGARAEPPDNKLVPRPVWDAFKGIQEFAEVARSEGGAPEFVDDLYAAAIALIGSIGRYREVMTREDVALAARRVEVRSEGQDKRSAADAVGEESQGDAPEGGA